MDVQIEEIVRDKILTGIELPLPDFTRREVSLPAIQGKAMVIIGMRRSGKTTFLHQCRADLMEQGPQNRVKELVATGCQPVSP